MSHTPDTTATHDGSLHSNNAPASPEFRRGAWRQPAAAGTGTPATPSCMHSSGTDDMIPKPISTATASHYTWGGTCDGWHLVKAAALSVIEERMPPGSSEVRHWHTRAVQCFYVLSGTVTLEVEGATHDLRAGFGIELPSGTAHQARNNGPDDARFLVISSPPHQGDRREAADGE